VSRSRRRASYSGDLADGTGKNGLAVLVGDARGAQVHLHLAAVGPAQTVFEFVGTIAAGEELQPRHKRGLVFGMDKLVVRTLASVDALGRQARDLMYLPGPRDDA